MGIPDCHALANAALRQKNLPILIPWLGFFSRTRNRIEDTLLALRLTDEIPGPVRIDSLFLRCINHRLKLRLVTVIARVANG